MHPIMKYDISPESIRYSVKNCKIIAVILALTTVIFLMQNMGVGKYVKDVAIPSVMINVLDRKDKLPYDYYSYPWEAEANKLGGSTLSDGKPPLPQDGYNSYWDLIKLLFE